MKLSKLMPWMHLLMLQWPVSARPQVALLVPQRKNKHPTPLGHPMPLLPWMLWPQKPRRRSHQRRTAKNELAEPFLMHGFCMVSIFFALCRAQILQLVRFSACYSACSHEKCCLLSSRF